MRILIDVDGVSADYSHGFVTVCNRLFGTTHTAADITQWDTAAALGLSAEQADACYQEIRKPGFALSLHLLPGARESVRQLQKDHDVYFVTTPFRGAKSDHVSWSADREHWLRDHFGAGSDRIIHTSAKHIVTGDVFVDDKPENVRAWQEHNPSGFGLLWYQPYNWDQRGELPVCHSWAHLFDILYLLETGTVMPTDPEAP